MMEAPVPDPGIENGTSPTQQRRWVEPLLEFVDEVDPGLELPGQIVSRLAQAAEAVPAAATRAVEAAGELAASAVEAAPATAERAIEAAGSLAEGIVQALPDASSVATSIVSGALDVAGHIISSIPDAVSD